jgi:hypothetical protein
MRFTTNRYVVTVLLIVLAIFVWKLYVRANDDGYIRGTVVDENGDGVAGAEVMLQERDLVIVEAPMSVRTDRDGHFIFEDMSLISFFIWAEKEDSISPEKRPYHLYFKQQNFILPEPLVITDQ